MEESIGIEQLRIPETLTGPDAADFLRAVEISRLVRLNTWGNDELAYTAQELLAQCHDPYEWNVVLVARVNGAMVGRAGIVMPLDDNTELAHVTLDVLPEAAGRGTGRRLLAAAEQFVRGENRRIVVVETDHSASGLAAATDKTEQIHASSGSGYLPLSSREARFAFSAGYELERVERFSSCALPLDQAKVQLAMDKAHTPYQGDYRTHQWLDTCPERWAEDVARLEHSFSGGQDDSGGGGDVAKLREAEEFSAMTGRRTIITAAESLASGTLIGFTSISILSHRQDVAFQDETLVYPEHKGKGVGLRIKVANMARVLREFPQVRTVYTWNAPENSQMLELNAQLGFVAAGITGQWRKDFNAY